MITEKGIKRADERNIMCSYGGYWILRTSEAFEVRQGGKFDSEWPLSGHGYAYAKNRLRGLVLSGDKQIEIKSVKYLAG